MNKPLFAIAHETVDPKTRRVVKANITYANAPDARTAEFGFRQAHGRQIAAKRLRVVGTAPVVGYFVDDNHGEKLSV